jgi:two-component system nitrogen regulation sensor histidine kinase NtrY
VTRKTKGTGLGLAIVKKIMEDHLGRLELSDRPDGKPGARVTLSLPLAVPAAEPVPSVEAGMQKAAHGA